MSRESSDVYCSASSKRPCLFRVCSLAWRWRMRLRVGDSYDEAIAADGLSDGPATAVDGRGLVPGWLELKGSDARRRCQWRHGKNGRFLRRWGASLADTTLAATIRRTK